MNIKNITFGIFCVGVLFSCTKEDMEVQKNTDLTWEVGADVIKGDVRTALGYDPRYIYVAPNISVVEFPISTLDDLVFSEELTNELKVTVSMGKVAENDIKVTLKYDPSLYPELNNTYGGYSLGDESLVKIDKKQKTIPAGESSVDFHLSGTFTGAERLILPYSLKLESEKEIKMLKGADYVVLKTKSVNFLDNNLLIKPLESSTKLAEAFNGFLGMPSSTQNFGGGFKISLNENISIGKFNDKLGVKFNVSFGSTIYESVRYVDIDQADFTIKPIQYDPNNFFDTSGFNSDWSYFSGDLEKVLELFTSNAPYKYEKLDNSTVKVISVKDPDIWFTIEKE